MTSPESPVGVAVREGSRGGRATPTGPTKDADNGKCDVVADPQPTDDQRMYAGITAKNLRELLTLMERLDAINAISDGRDLAVGAYGTLQVVVESDDRNGEHQSLIGWLSPTEDWWDFVPCVPPLRWSARRGGWVDIAILRADNAAKRAAL